RLQSRATVTQSIHGLSPSFLMAPPRAHLRDRGSSFHSAPDGGWVDWRALPDSRSTRAFRGTLYGDPERGDLTGRTRGRVPAAGSAPHDDRRTPGGVDGQAADRRLARNRTAAGSAAARRAQDGTRRGSPDRGHARNGRGGALISLQRESPGEGARSA